jgi:flagellar basal body-associated protein FliL
MNKKTIIQLVIIVVAFGAAGVVLYNGFFQGGVSHSPQDQGMGGASSTPQEILPYGNNLDFNHTVNSNRFLYNQISFPQVNPQQDVGIPVGSLIPPPPLVSQGGH